ncbi:MAG: hypothetical protein U9N87_02740 [Planctomycetota bacterium]|nr:hypothetical protein [Planctomycetota bacterium]
MPFDRFDLEIPAPSVETHLLGRIEYGQCAELQERLVGQIARRDDGQIRLLFCEHPQIITVGRGGSPGDVQLDSKLIRHGQIEVRWVKRGGGCMVHLPGQLAVYPIVPLRWHGMSVGQYLDRFQAGILAALDELDFPAQTRPPQTRPTWGEGSNPAADVDLGTNQPHAHGIWGRNGRLVTFGIAVRDWVSSHGAFINVCPAMGLFKLIDGERQSSLMIERRHRANMSGVRAALVRHLSESLGCGRYHIYTGHPMLKGKTILPTTRH